jgi:hypothetical protein
MSVECQQETHAPQQFNSSFDHLVGDGEQLRRHLDAKGARAIFRFLTNSNLVACTTGKSSGFVPART